MKVNPRVKLLKELVRDGLYVVDDVAVADAVLLRTMTRLMLARSERRPAHGTAARRPRPPDVRLATKSPQIAQMPVAVGGERRHTLG